MDPDHTEQQVARGPEGQRSHGLQRVEVSSRDIKCGGWTSRRARDGVSDERGRTGWLRLACNTTEVRGWRRTLMMELHASTILDLEIWLRVNFFSQWAASQI